MLSLPSMARLAVGTVCVFALAIAAGVSRASAESALIISPDALPLAKLCKPEIPVAIPKEDWTKWDGKSTKVPVDMLIGYSSYYSEPNLKVAWDRQTAIKLLDYAARQPGPSQSRAMTQYGVVLSSKYASQLEKQHALKLLKAAFDGGDRSAAAPLAKLLLSEDLVEKSASEALRVLKIGLAARQQSAGMALAWGMATGDFPETESNTITDVLNQTLLMLLDDVKAGKCENLSVIGYIYGNDAYRSFYSPKVAAAWYSISMKNASWGGAANSVLRLSQMKLTGEIDLAEDVDTLLQRAVDLGQIEAARELIKRKIYLDATSDKHKQAVLLAVRLERLRDPEVSETLARIYLGHFGDEKNSRSAAPILLKLIERENAPDFAFEALAVFYEQGALGRVDLDAARTTLERLSQRGSSSANSELGRFYALGIGVPVDELKSLAYYRLSASYGDAGSFSKIERAYTCSPGVKQDLLLAQYWRERGLWAGSGSIVFEQAVASLRKGDPEALRQRVAFLRLAVAASDSRKAMSLLGQAYEFGQGIRIDKSVAQAWYARALAKGDDMDSGYLEVANRYLELPGGEEGGRRAIAVLEQGVRLNLPSSMYRLGSLLQIGVPGIPIDQERGRELVRRAAILNYPDALFDHAMKVGDGRDSDGLTQLDWLKRAVLAGHNKAGMVLSGKVPPDEGEAQLDAVRRKASCSPDDQFDLSDAYVALGTESAAKKSLSILAGLQARATDNVDIAYALGDYYAKRESAHFVPDKAATYLEQAAIAGHADAPRELGHVLLAMNDDEATREKARTWFKVALDRGDGKAAVPLFDLMLYRFDAKGNLTDEARKLLETGARVGSVSAMRELGRADIGSDREDLRKAAVSSLERAAALGDEEAIRLLQRSYTFGVGTPVDPAKAVSFTMKLAELGDPKAAYDLSVYYADGAVLPKNPEKAKFWREKADQLQAQQAATPAP